ncbi:hypothetical protein KIH86_27595 [Paenibacillus sp. HN-1]|uniref:hypothetical protein n=1 Tax=Paenibacillus TaxID=44249 RepID=UPI001CA9AD9D|nr:MULTISPECIES: hypothetical protein [Paenibacillus]MBY9082418.1 hypothetical protein [Paenibacillus sp. CGMCC 1.18879]MBY9087958.1 hypothetical protein [Paenibacillus sinensis]
MRNWIACGWKSVKEQLYILILLFLYRLLWGYCLYRFIRSAVVPALLRYPSENAGGSASSRLLYSVEAQLGLIHDPAVMRWLWTLLILAAVRLLLTPFIRAGLLYELHQESRGERGLFFFPGMKKYGLPILLFSVIEWILTLLPLYWLLPAGLRLLHTSPSGSALLVKAISAFLVWLLYVWLIRLLLLYMQFGYTGETGILPSLLTALRRFPSAAGIGILMGGGILLVVAISAAAGLLFPGFPALLIRQLAPLPSLVFGLWGLASQYHTWRGERLSS